jgi:hypothetical protein
MAHALRRRRVDDDEGFDDRVYDRRFYPRRVYRDGMGPSVPLYLTDHRPSPRQPMFDARVGRPGPVAAKLVVMCGRQAISDAQQARIDDAYQSYCNRLCDQWAWGKPGVLAPVTLGDARVAYIKRTSNAWKKPTPLSHLRRGRDEDDDDPDAETDPEQARQAYLERVWSAQAAIQPGSPDAAAQVEAMQRRMSMSQPNVTGESVAAERRRYRPSDAEAIADRETAYAEYCRRIENGWRR